MNIRLEVSSCGTFFNVWLRRSILAQIDFFGPRSTIYVISGWLTAEERKEVYRLYRAA